MIIQKCHPERSKFCKAKFTESKDLWRFNRLLICLRSFDSVLAPSIEGDAWSKNSAQDDIFSYN
jgi:hypothetical protein